MRILPVNSCAASIIPYRPHPYTALTYSSSLWCVSSIQHSDKENNDQQPHMAVDLFCLEADLLAVAFHDDYCLGEILHDL
jgi:hypothetical protein